MEKPKNKTVTENHNGEILSDKAPSTLKLNTQPLGTV